MLKFTEEEQDAVVAYYLSQSKDASVTFTQKVYAETVIGHTHEVWDLHASDGRWWIVTNPTNLYSQDQFPNLDLALTFHMGLCLRIPRTDRQGSDVTTARLFGSVLQAITDCDEALSQANDAGAYRAIGVRCRENLLAFIHAVQGAFEWPDNNLQKSNFVGWADLICDELLPSPANRERRRVFKLALKEAWTYVNWLTHSQSGTWIDAEVATTSVSYALGMAINLVMRKLRSVPDQCPQCESGNLSPIEGFDSSNSGVIFERPICDDCGWMGDIVCVGERSDEEVAKFITREGETSDTDGVLAMPLTGLVRPQQTT
ncbi:MAG: hypothetical protein BM560_01105 [Roseobacter sp. MedPE-SWde]|mgnify:CR=1 FL=1|nr:MAG: hypothetical protein BM560_01105 [Roseobacter sp. MedPE-SWde]